MKIRVKNNSIFADDLKVSNFSICKLDEGLYEIDNGEQIAKCEINSRNLLHFKKQVLISGCFIFMGNTKHLEAILDSLEYQGKAPMED